MLHTETVERTTLELLRKLQAERLMESFCLAGGTALALYLGHRKSVDLDLFTARPFDVSGLRDFLETAYDFRTGLSARNTLKGTIGQVKVDCITHAYWKSHAALTLLAKQDCPLWLQYDCPLWPK